MKVLQVEARKSMKLHDIAKPVAGPDDVIVRVSYCGICGSDLPRFFEGAVHRFPQILGHEVSGTIDEIGSAVSNLSIGDRVIVAPFIPCGKCELCRAGEPQLCNRYGFIGSREPGAFAKFVRVPAANIVPVPDRVSLKDAALVEPLSVAINAVERFSFRAGERALVLGAGTIGLMVVAVLRARGVMDITVVDPNAKRLKFAREIGADTVINPFETDLKKYFSVRSRPALTFETAGVPITQVQAISLTADAGRVVYVGTSQQDVTFKPEEFETIFRRELLITGNMMSYSLPFPGTAWTAALRFIECKLIKVGCMITGVYHLEDGAEPFFALAAPDSCHIKIVYDIRGER